MMCEVDACGRPVKSRQLCQRHYDRWRRHGDPLKGGPLRRNGDIHERLWSRVEVGPLSEHRPDLGPCLLWTGAISPYGYGHIGIGGRVLRCHCVAYELVVGPIPDGLQLDHLCRVRHCIRPDHLEPVTSAENTRRGAAARRKPRP